MSFLRLARALVRCLVSLILALAVLWAAALWIDGPESRALAGALALGLVLIAGLAAVLVRPWRRAALGVALAFAVVLAWWLTLPPSNDREWQPDVARLPTATLDGSLLTPFARRMRRSGPAPISVGPSHTLIADNPHP